MQDCKPSDPKAFPPLATSEVGFGAPDPGLCEVEALVPSSKVGWCQVRPVPCCPLGVSCGDGYLCFHPEIHRIIARTWARKSSAQPFEYKPPRQKGWQNPALPDHSPL
jgi:hypothetical protein